MGTESLTHAMTTGRPYRDDRDWWAIRSLLVETLPLTSPNWNWEIRRWDGWPFHRAEPATADDLARVIRLWETPEGGVVGAVHPESAGEAYLEVHPDHRDLEPEMVAWAEDHLAVASPVGDGRVLTLYVDDADEPRRRLLADRGYAMEASGGWVRRLRFGDRSLVPVPELPAGYRLRTTEPTDADCDRMAAVLNAGFGRAAHTAREYRTFMDRSPSFEHELNLVAVAPDGSFAAHAGFTWDAVNRHGIVEPVCTHPDHRRLGLARVLVLDGVRRLAGRGARTAALDTGEGVAANAMYVACGFTEAHHGHPWRREL